MVPQGCLLARQYSSHRLISSYIDFSWVDCCSFENHSRTKMAVARQHPLQRLSSPSRQFSLLFHMAGIASFAASFRFLSTWETPLGGVRRTLSVPNYHRPDTGLVHLCCWAASGCYALPTIVLCQEPAVSLFDTIGGAYQHSLLGTMRHRQGSLDAPGKPTGLLTRLRIPRRPGSLFDVGSPATQSPMDDSRIFGNIAEPDSGLSVLVLGRILFLPQWMVSI